MRRDGEASPVGAAEVFALNGVLRVDGSLVLPLLVLVLVLELLLEVVPAPREVDPFVLPSRRWCRRRYQPLQALLLRSRTSIASWCPGECSNSSRSLLLRRLLRKGEGAVGRRSTTPSASAAATTNSRRAGAQRRRGRNPTAPTLLLAQLTTCRWRRRAKL